MRYVYHRVSIKVENLKGDNHGMDTHRSPRSEKSIYV
jgi:hypothetical protein